MKVPFKKKAIYTIVAAASGIAISQFAFAANNNNQKPPQNGGNGIGSGAVVAAINELGNKVVALATAGAKSVNHLMYQLDKNLAPTMKANTATVGKYTVRQTVNAEAKAYTNNNIQNSLQQIVYTVTPPKPHTAAAEAQENYLKKNSPIALSAIKASDTLYTPPLLDPFQAVKYNTVKPTQLHDNYFNFDSLLSPTAYNSGNQLTAARRYIQFATQSYKPLDEGMDLQNLRNESPKALRDFMNSPAYRKFQLSVRSTLAARSVALSNFNYLVAERTPIKNLGAEAGMPTKNASPLQVESYIANHRVRSKQWYKQVATATPATVQRETLMVLAEMESQNYQAHLDRERVISTLSALEMQSAQLGQLLAKANASSFSEAMKSAANNGTDNNGQAEASAKSLKKQMEDAKNGDSSDNGDDSSGGSYSHSRSTAKKNIKKYGVVKQLKKRHMFKKPGGML